MIAEPLAVFLWNSPGTGKTLPQEAAAAESDYLFYCLRSSDIISGQAGKCEPNVWNLSATVRRHHLAALFLDEVEALPPATPAQDMDGDHAAILDGQRWSEQRLTGG